MKKIVASGATAILALSVLNIAPAAFAAESIVGGGSSYMNTIQQECKSVDPEVTVTYTKSSSGTGRTNFRQGTFDFGGADAPYAATDVKPKSFTYVPLITGPIVFVYNIAGVSNLKLDAATLSDIFTGTITMWNDAAIKKLNPTAKLPAEPIGIIYRSTSSGTTENLAAYFSQVVKEKGWIVNGTYTTASKNSKGTGVADNAQVVSTVAKTAFSIGYADLADAQTAGLPYASVKNGAGQFVAPSTVTAGKFIAQASMKANGLIAFDYNKKVPGAYNVTLASYGVAPKGGTTTKAEATEIYFEKFLSTCAPAKAAGLGYVALNGTALKTALKLAESISTK